MVRSPSKVTVVSAASVKVLKSAGIPLPFATRPFCQLAASAATSDQKPPAPLIHTGVGMSVKVPNATALLPRPGLVANALTFHVAMEGKFTVADPEPGVPLAEPVVGFGGSAPPEAKV